MSNHAWILLGLFLTVLLLTVKPLGTYIANVMEGRFRLAGKIDEIHEYSPCWYCDRVILENSLLKFSRNMGCGI